MKHPAADTGVKDQMSIAVDGRCLNTSHLRGIGKYLYHLIANSSDIQWTVFGEHPNEPLFIPEATNVHAMFFRFGGSRYQTWEQIGLPIQMRRNPGIQLALSGKQRATHSAETGGCDHSRYLPVGPGARERSRLCISQSVTSKSISILQGDHHQQFPIRFRYRKPLAPPRRKN